MRWIMTVKELIDRLKNFPEDMEVVDEYEEITDVYKGILMHNNYPYDKPDKEVVVIY